MLVVKYGTLYKVQYSSYYVSFETIRENYYQVLQLRMNGE